MPKPNAGQVLKTLNSICHRIHMEPASMRSHMNELTALLREHDAKETAQYSWLEASIRQAQLNRFTECCTHCGEEYLLCLVKIQGTNSYNLCFTNDVDQCICRLRSLCRKPVELVVYGKAKLIPEALLEVLSDPKIQKNRWFPLTDIQLKRVVKTLKSRESIIIH